MSTCVEPAARYQKIAQCVPAFERGNFVFPADPETRPLENAGQAKLCDFGPGLNADAIAENSRQVVCLHSEADEFNDICITFASADCRQPEFGAILRWLQEEASEPGGLGVSIGIASSKVVAGIASRIALPGKACVVAPGAEESFLAPVSVRKLRGLVQMETRALAERGISTIGQLRQIPKPVLVSAFGEASGRALWDTARGRDARTVNPGHVLRRRTVPGAATGQPGWVRRLMLQLSVRLDALDRALERILVIPAEEVPPRTTPIP